MKVVVAHNRYRSGTPSGENRVVDAEIDLLRATGVEVIPFIEDSDELLRPAPGAFATGVLGPIASPRGVRRLRGLLDAHSPDVLHLHNVYPLISPWVVRTAAARDVPVVQTVHNYRHTCVAGIHLRDHAVCLDCTEHRVPWPAVRHGCYRGSHLQSFLMAAGQLAHRSTWTAVSRFLVTSPLMHGLLSSTGIEDDRIEWRPTWAEDVGTSPIPAGGGVAFIGRLEEAKGVALLLDAWTPEVAARWGRLVVAGDGPLAGLVATRAEHDRSVELRGRLDGDGVIEVMRDAALVAIPSLWFEGFPRVAAEALSLGRPLLVWEGAGFSTIATSGAAWALASEPSAWTRCLLDLDPDALCAASVAARSFYEGHCRPDAAAAQLLRTYAALAPTSAPA